MTTTPRIKLGLVTTTLRLTLGFYFFAGGLSAFLMLLMARTQIITLRQFTGSTGFVNRFINELFFDWLPPLWFFLIAASVCILIGIYLLLGLFTRYTCIAGIVAIVLQCLALPVITIPNMYVAIDAYTVPASLVLALQIGIIGLLLCQYYLGAGPKSLDRRIAQTPESPNTFLASRALHIGATYPLLIGALFGWRVGVPNFSVTPYLLLIVVLLIQLPWNGCRRASGAALAFISIWYLSGTIQPGMNFWQGLFAIRLAIVYFFVGILLTHFFLVRKPNVT